jgi:hypothetical protein
MSNGIVPGWPHSRIQAPLGERPCSRQVARPVFVVDCERLGCFARDPLRAAGDVQHLTPERGGVFVAAGATSGAGQGSKRVGLD